MADIDYKAIADELRASHEAPRVDMLPGEYVVATAIEHLANAIGRVKPPVAPEPLRWMIRRYAFALPWYVFEFNHARDCYWTDPGMQFPTFEDAIRYTNTRRDR